MYLLNLKVKWRFNLERAPWWGGFFERLIRSVKRCLNKILKNAKLSYEELLTVVTEVECVLNSCPLTYLFSEDIEEPLTTSHVMTGRRLLSIPDEIAVDEEDTSEVSLLTRRQRYLLLLLSFLEPLEARVRGRVERTPQCQERNFQRSHNSARKHRYCDGRRKV